MKRRGLIHEPYIIQFLLQNLEFEYIKEDVGYGTIDLLCDVGGTLSLLMGASLLTCCELLEVAWIVMAKKCCRKVGKTLAAPGRGAKKRFQSQDHGVSGGISSGTVAAELDAEKAVHAHAELTTPPASSNTTKLQTKL